MPSSLMTNIRRRINVLSALIEVKTEAVRTAPEGKVCIKSSRGYSRMTSDDPEADEDKIRRMVQRDYDCLVIKAASTEIEYLSQVLKRYPSSVEDVYDKLHDGRKPFVRSICLTDDEYAEQWLTSPFEQKTCISSYVTRRGECVRSKSEIIIADRLYDRGIPYRYEAGLQVGNQVFHPDFTILDIAKRREVYLEHLGMLGDPDYANRNIERINTYIKNGFLLNNNLLLTMENCRTPLDTVALDAMLDSFTPMSDELKARLFP